MEATFSFLDPVQADMLREILTRRNAPLLEVVQRDSQVSRSAAEQVMNILSDEVVDNLDDDGEPTRYGRDVSAVLGRFNAERIREWP
jgi:hypothetical protein